VRPGEKGNIGETDERLDSENRNAASQEKMMGWRKKSCKKKMEKKVLSTPLQAKKALGGRISGKRVQKALVGKEEDWEKKCPWSEKTSHGSRKEKVTKKKENNRGGWLGRGRVKKTPLRKRRVQKLRTKGGVPWERTPSRNMQFRLLLGEGFASGGAAPTKSIVELLSI